MKPNLPQPEADDTRDAGDLRFTQNFLHHPALVERIVALARLQLGATVLEIGPGRGIITRVLAQQVTSSGRVIAVELDNRLASTLHETFRDTPHVEILNTNILRYKLDALPANYVVFSNVPFNITSELLEHLFNPHSGPAQAYLILQKDTLMGVLPYQPNVTTETLKSLMIKPLYTLDLVHTFTQSDFMPQPSVETGLFAFTKHATPHILPTYYEMYKDFLAFVSKDRVGEGAWTKVFSKNQLVRMAAQYQLVHGRGLKSQSFTAILSAFKIFAASSHTNQGIVKGAMARLREEQQRKDEINRAGRHRRPTPSKERDTRVIPTQKRRSSGDKR